MRIFEKYPGSKFLQRLQGRPDLFGLSSKIDELYPFISGLEDSHFETELDADPHSRIWEMMVAQKLTNSGFKLKSADKGPDFIFEINNQTICVEAICPTLGLPGLPDSVPPLVFDTESAQLVPIEKLVLRVSAAIKEKQKKFEAYLSGGVIPADSICIIAISSSKFDGRGHTSPNLGLQAALGCGTPYIVYDRDDHEFKDEGISFRAMITKSNTSEVNLTPFLDPRNAVISGLLYSDDSFFSLSYPNDAHTCCIHNPTAWRTVHAGTFKVSTEYWTIASANKDAWSIFSLNP